MNIKAKALALIELYNQTRKDYFVCGNFEFPKDWWKKNDIVKSLLIDDNWKQFADSLPDYFEQTLRYGRKKLLEIKRLYVNDGSMLCVNAIHNGMFRVQIYHAFNFYNMIISDGMIYYDKANAMDALTYILKNGKEREDALWMSTFLSLMGCAQVYDLEDVLRAAAKDITNSTVIINHVKEIVEWAPGEEVCIND